MHGFANKDAPSQEMTYPLDTDCYAPTGEDRSLCDQRLRTESLRLFQSAGGGLDILVISQDDGKPPNLPDH